MTSDSRDSEETEIAALFARLREEVAMRGLEAASGSRAAAQSRSLGSPTLARDQAKRSWAVTADRRFLYKPGRWGRIRGVLLAPLKMVLRKLMRWYVEPAFAQQRDFNTSVLRTLDELSERIDAVAERATQVERRPRG
jgi:hypothetical protein